MILAYVDVFSAYTDVSANDKSFSRLFSEAPFLPESAFKLLDDICCSDNNCGKDIRNGEHAHQGLGSLWNLILGFPNTRQAFLDIALRLRGLNQKSKEVFIPKPHVKLKPVHVKQKPPLLLKIVMMRKRVTQWRED
ncbi:hypothetical protein CTI12_AA227510 [Artemisia annua]|uniref:Uncharacterized protein n=1 Tax=Artemisia annua TaxID=35608 RepID=A0A2U1NUE1_ARTAN|nr:hypothetical protein CTI12_AA227510 [Artemisia annua]